MNKEIKHLEELKQTLTEKIKSFTAAQTDLERKQVREQINHLQQTLDQEIANYKQALKDPYQLMLRQNLANEYNLFYVGAFSPEGLATARTRNNSWNYINKKGEFLLNARAHHNLNIKEVRPFQQGLGVICSDQFKYRFIDEMGVTLPTNFGNFEFESIKDITDLIAVKDKDTWMYLDLNLKEVYRHKKQIFSATSFYEGYAVIESHDSGFKYINQKFQPDLVNIPLFKARAFSEGVSVMRLSENLREVIAIDPTGKTLFHNEFVEIDSFHEGVALARRKDIGFINKTGDFVIGPQYHFAKRFAEGLALVTRSRWESIFFINQKNENMFDLPSNFVNSYSTHFSEGVFSYFDENHLIHYLDHNGELVFTK